VLAVSLALNLLIVGLVAGLALRAGPGADGHPALRDLGLGPFVLAMDRDDRAALRERLAAQDLRADRIALGRSLRGLQAALRSEPFDRAAAAAALTDGRRAAEALQAGAHAALLDQMAEMDPAARRALADRLNRALRRADRRVPAP
jgi:hypothetical protein